MKIFAFLKSTMRLTTAIFLSGLALIVVIGLGSVGYNAWEKSRAKQYETIKEWKADTQANLQFLLFARTKLVDGRLFLKVNTNAFPEYLKNPYLKAQKADQEVILNFVDADGFKVYSKSIAVKSFSTNVDSEGKPIALSFEADEVMDVRTYASMAHIDVQWTIDTTTPANLTAAETPPRQLLDHCAPNLSKAERLRRLAQHGEVRQTGDGNFSVGYRSLTFLHYDNSLLSCH